MTRRSTPEKPIANVAAEAPPEVSESPTGNTPMPRPDSSPNPAGERMALADQAAERAVEPLDDGYEPL